MPLLPKLPKPGTFRRTAAAALIVIFGDVALAAAADDIKPLAMEQVAPGIFVHQGVHGEATAENHGGIANIGFIVGAEAVAVIDSGGSAVEGRRLRAAVRAATDLPIRYVINTHGHPDHIFGNAAFVDDAPAFIGHAKLAGALVARGPFYLENLAERLGEAAAGTRVVPPTQEIGERREIDLGGRVLRLVAHPTAHTDNDLSVLDVETSTLWLSDLLFMDRIPAIDGSLKGWLEVIAELRQVEAARVIPGHGPVSARWPGALDAQERYLRTLLEEIRALLAEAGTIEQAVETVGRSERGKWLLFDAYHARNIVTAFTELEWE